MLSDRMTSGLKRQEELGPIVTGRLNPDRWQEYKEFRLKALEEEPVAFQDPIRGRQKLLKLQEGEWRAMLEGRSYDGDRTRKIICVAEAGGKLIGMGDIEIAHILGEIKITGNNLFVPNELRGRGIARKLIQAMIHELENDKELQKDNFDLNLMVYGTQKEAIALYESLGFEVVEIIKGDKEYQGEKIDRYVMKRKFKK